MHQLIVLAALLLAPSGAAVGPGSLHVRIDGYGSVAKFYVAAVSIERPNASPEREEIVDVPDVIWSLPAGSYRILAGEIDHATSTSRLVTVVSGGTASVSLTLRPLAAVAGRVLGIDGRGIPNARVGLPGAFRLDYRDKLSPMAEQFLQSNTLVRTDDTGSFVLPIQTGGTSYVYVEADEHSPQMLARVDASDSTARELRLGEGAKFNLEINHIPSEYDRIRLIPTAVELPAHLSLSGAVALWTRRSERSQAWRSVPAGRYLVCLGTSNEASILTPYCLADVVLHTGEQHLKVRTPDTVPQPRPTPSAAVTLLLSNAARVSDDAHVVQWESGRGRVVQGEASKDHSKITVRGCLPGARYFLYSSSTVAASKEITDCSAQQSLVAYPRATASLHLGAPIAATLPQSGFVRFSPCTHPGDEIVLPFTVDAFGLAKFPAPAGCSTPVLVAPPFALARLPIATFAAGETLEFKEVFLNHGATVTGRLLDTTNVPVANAVVVLLSAPQVDGSLGSNARAKARAVHVARTDNFGWVKVTGVADGDYIVAFTPPSATLPQTTGRFAVRPEESFFLPDTVAVTHGSVSVLLKNQSRVLPTRDAVCVAVPTREVAWPSTWNVSVPAQDGECAFRDLLSGSWLVHATIGAVEGESFETAPAEVVVNGNLSMTVLDVSQSEYHGVVLNRRVPVAGGILEIGPAVGAASVRVRVSIQRDGSFGVILPKSGPYALDIQSQESGTLGRLPNVHFAESGTNTIINAPQGIISGIVGSISGAPVAGVMLRLDSAADESGTLVTVARVASGRDGRFTFHFLADGAWVLRTESDQFASKPAYVTIRDGAQVQPVFLVAETKR